MYNCVFRLGPKSGPREPRRAEERTRTFSEGPFKNRTKIKHAENQMFYDTKRLSDQKLGSLLSKNGVPLERFWPF